MVNTHTNHPILNSHITNKFLIKQNISKSRTTSTTPQETTRIKAEDIVNLSWLKDAVSARTAPFDLKMFSLESADAFISETKHLEGENFHHTLPRFLECFENTVQFMSENGIINETIDTSAFKECSDEAQNIYEALMVQKASTRETHDYATTLIKKTQNLKKGNSMWLPGGWSGNPGHAVLYRVQKQTNGKYSFTIFNTGGGLNYHDSIIVDGEEKYQTQLTIKDIDPKKFLTPEIYQHLLELQIQSSSDVNAEFSERNIYIGVINYLDGTRVSPENPKDYPELYMQPQRSGSCAMKSIFAMLRQAIIQPDGQQTQSTKEKLKRLQTYKTIKFFYKRQSLLDMCDEYFKSNNYDRTTHRLISQVASQWARAARKLYNGGVNPYQAGGQPILSEEILQKVEATVLDIKEKLSQQKIAHNKIENTFPLSLSLELSDQVKSESVLAPDVWRNHLGISHSLPSHCSIDNNPVIEGKPSDPKQVMEYLSSQLQQLQNIDKKDDKHQAIKLYDKKAEKHHLIKSFTRAVRRLPVPTHNDDVWNQLDPSEIVNCLETLHLLSKFSFISGQQTPDSFVALNTLLAIGDKLTRRLPESKLTDQDKISHYELVTFYHSSEITLENPEDQKRVMDLITYFDPTFDAADRPIEKINEKNHRERPYAILDKKREKCIFALSRPEYSRIRFTCKEKSDVQKNPYLIYLTRFLKGDEAKRTLMSMNANQRTLPEQVGLLLTEEIDKAKLLPKCVHYLRQLSYSTQLVAMGENVAYNHKEFTHEEETETDYKTKIKTLTGNYSLQSIEPSKYGQQNYREGISGWDGQNLTDKMMINWKKYSPVDLDEEEKQKKHFYRKDQNTVMANYSVERDRDIRLIDVDSEDEVIRTLAYYMNLPQEKLENKTDQKFLLNHIFRPGRLLPLITNEPQTAIKLLSFINHYVDQYVQMQKFQPALFFATLGYRCSQHILFAKKENPDLFGESLSRELDLAMRNYRQVILEEVKPTCKGLKDLSRLYHDLAGMYTAFEVEESGDSESLKNLSIDYLTAQLIQPIALIENPEGITDTVNERKHLKQFDSYILECITKLLDTDQKAKNTILSTVIENIKNCQLEQLKHTDWKGAYPLYETVDGEYKINCEKYIVYEKGKPIVALPKDVVQSNAFKKIFQDITDIRSLNDRNTLLEIRDANGISQIDISNFSIWNPEFNVKRQFGRSEFDSSLPSYYYMSYRSFDNRIKTSIPYEFLDSSDQKTSIWYQKEELDAESPHYMIKDHRTGQHTYIQMKKESQNMVVDTISDTLSGERILTDPRKSHKLDCLRNIEHISHIACWADSNARDIVKEIDLPRLGLHFTVGENHAYCREVPGYYIDENQDIDYIGKDKASLILTNDVGDKKVIIPMGVYGSTIRSTSEVYDPSIGHQTSFDDQGKSIAGVYDLKDEEGIFRLKPNSVRDAVHLVSQLFHKKRYKQVNYYLKDVYALQRYTKEEAILLGKLCADSKDSHPSAIMLRLRVLVTLQDNESKYKTPKEQITYDSKEWLEVAKTYSKYLSNRSNTLVDQLSIEEEKTLLRCLQKAEVLIIPTLLNRLDKILHPEKNSLKMGMRDSTKLDDASPLKRIEQHILLGYLEVPKSSDPNEIRDYSISTGYMSEGIFKTAFPRLYIGARHGDKETRQYIKNVLRLMEGNNLLSNNDDPISGKRTENGQMIALACLLKKVCDHPNKFPSRKTLLEINKFKYDGKYHENHKSHWNDKWKKEQAWRKRQRSVYSQILKHGENSRKKGGGPVEALKQYKKMMKASSFYSPANIEQLTSISEIISNKVPPSDFEHPMDIHDEVTGRDTQWDNFFSEFFVKEKNFFTITEKPKTEPVKFEEEKAERSGKKKEMADKLEEFYATIPDHTNAFTFDLQQTEQFLDTIRHKLFDEVRGLTDKPKIIEALKKKNQRLFEVYEGIFVGNSEAPKNISESIEQMKLTIQSLLLLRQLRVEALINDMPEDANIDVSLSKLGKQEKSFTLNDAIALFEIGSEQAYKETTSMCDEQRKNLDKEVGLYGIDVTRCMQLEGVLNLLQKLNGCKSEGGEKTLLHQRLGEQLTIQRNHLSNGKTGRSRSYLRYEMKEGIILRAIQVDVLDDILDQDEPLQLMEILGTGSGKTKVLSPMKQWLRRKEGARLIINVWPSQHYPVNRDDVRHQVVQNYGQRSDTIDFNRNMDSSLDTLKFMYRELARDIYDIRQVNSTPESLQSSELKFLEILYNENFEDIEYPKGTIAIFQKILKLLSQSEIHVDEGHINFSPKREVNFTVGDPSIENKKYVELMSKVYELLVSDELDGLVRLRTNQQHLLSKDDYANIVAPTIADKLIDYLKIDKLDAQKVQEYRGYVLGTATKIPDWVMTHKNRQQIALLRGELSFILQDTLSRSTSVHYGLSKESKKIEFAKPYDANDSCVEKAEYDNITEAFNKTFQIYLHKRLTVNQQWKLIKHLRESAREECSRKPIDFPVKDAKAYQFFSNSFPEGLLKKNLFAISKEDIESQEDEINLSDTIIFYYVNNIVAPQVKKYGYKLKSDSQNLRSMFSDVTTMTATPGSIETYGFEKNGKKDAATINKGNDAEVLSTLNTKCSSNEQFTVLDCELPKDILETIVSTLNGEDDDARMLIDIGALFKGISNEAVAKAILKNKPSLHGVAFYNDDNNLVMLEDSGRIIPFTQSQLRPHERFTYCDNKHMFGSDVKQSPNAKGICTFGTHINLDDMLQGVGRLREFLKDQTAKWVATKGTMEAIDPHYADKSSFFSVIRDHAILNQEKREADEIFRSAKQQMRNEIRALCMKKLRNASASKALTLFKSLKDILVDKVLDDPFTLYGQIQETVTGVEALEKYRLGLITKFKAMRSQFTKSEYRAIQKKLTGYKEEIKKLEEKLPKEVTEFNGEVGTESEVQVQVESEVEQEIESISNNTDGLHNRTPTKWPAKLDLYKGEWHKPTSVSTVAAKVQRTWFTYATDFLVKFFKPTVKLCSGLKKIFTETANRRVPFTVKIIARTIVSSVATVVITVNAVAFPILGLPIFIMIGATATVVETFKFIFLRGRVLPEVVKPTIFGVMAAKNSVKTEVPFYSLESVVRNHSEKDISSASKLFKETATQRIRFTNNILRKVPENTSDVTMKALGKEQKPLHEVLVIEDIVKGKKRYTVIAGDQSTDAKFWRDKLRADKENTSDVNAKKRKRKICLFDLKLGIIQNGKNAIDEKELRASKDFQQILVKLKLFNADIKYTESEEAQLLEMAKDPKDRLKLQKFLKRAIVHHDSKIQGLYGSRVNRILSENDTKKKIA
jgi:hypothetical protein